MMARNGGPTAHNNASAGAREREFYKYYEPFRAGLEGDNGDKKRSSTDKALAAFCQLGSIRLGVRRVLISGFDRKSQYVLAEATRSLSLHTDKPEHSDDELWLGSCIRPRPAMPCEYTYLNAQDGLDTGVSVEVISDVKKHAMDTSYPHTPPGLHFYAGVPIKSPNGYAIGTYCAFDDVVRDDFTDEQHNFMQDMALTVMTHLDFVRGKEEHRRAARMVLGLGNYVEGKSSLHDWYGHAKQESETKERIERNIRSVQDEQNEQNTRKRRRDEGSEERVEQGGAHVEMHLPSTPKRPKSEQSQQSDATGLDLPHHLRVDRDVSTPNTSYAPTHGGSDTAESETKSSTDVTKLEALGLPHSISPTFARASNLIVEAIEVQGSMFFDASIGRYGGLVDHLSDDYHQGGDDSETEELEKSPRSGRKVPSNPSQAGDQDPLAASDIKCTVLGYATSATNTSSAPPKLSKDFSLTERFLHTLFKRHPRGKIFNFDPEIQNLDSSQSNQPFGTHPDEKHHEDPAVAPDDFGEQIFPAEPPLHDPVQKRKRHRQLQDEMRTLRLIFPGVRSLAFVPLWDSHRQRWFAGSIAWSTSPIRLLHMDSELSFLAAFGHSIMSEVARLDTAIADKAKADLLSSISHELRSPLHGILGSVECLEEAGMGMLEESLVRTIETCGRTLLDTIDHLLDFSKINNFAQAAKSGLPASRRDMSEGVSNPSNGMMSLDIDVDVSAITEEAVETVFAGYDFSKGASKKHSLPVEPSVGSWDSETRVSEPSKRRNVALILNIMKSTELDWFMRLQAGAWRRVVMNLCGNALKYTAEGFISVKLEVQAIPDDHHRKYDRVILTVTDSGKGMSQEYLQTRLFTPFAQEDPLLPGTGLGLSIVKQIVVGMGGEIAVDSEVGRGTEIRVEVVLPHSPQEKQARRNSITSLVTKKTEGLKVGFLGSDEYASLGWNRSSANNNRTKENTQSRFFDGFSRSLKDWFGMNLTAASRLEDLGEVDVLVTTEAQAANLKEQISHGLKDRLDMPAVLVFCESASSAQRNFAENQLTESADVVEFLPQPIGPRKLARALAISFDRKATQKNDNARQTECSPETTKDQNSGAARIPDNKQPLIKEDRPEDQSRKQASVVTNHTGPSAATLATMSPPTQAPKQTPPSTGPPPSTGLHLLLVDDNKINLQILERYLKVKKHSYLTADTGLSALETYMAVMSRNPSLPKNTTTQTPSPRPFDLVLMDISMPIMDGLESTRRIRAFEKTNQLVPTTIIALTGLASASAQQEAFSSGVDLFLTKPVRLKELAGVLEGVKRDGKGKEG